MKKAFAILMSLMLLTSAAHAQTKAQIDADIDSTITSGKSPRVNAADFRKILHEMNAATFAVPNLNEANTWTATQTFTGISGIGSNQLLWDSTATSQTIGVLNIGRKTLAPTNIAPAMTMSAVGKGDNTTFIGVQGGYWAVADDASVDANSKGVLYGLAISMRPSVSRNNVPYDDVAAIVAQNDSPGTAKGTDAYYLGHNSNFAGGAAEWVTSFLTDANSDIAYRATATYGTGLDFSSATFTGAPIRVPLMTPASQTDACTQGSIKWDASYIYVCTSSNHWKRAALSDTSF